MKNKMNKIFLITALFITNFILIMFLYSNFFFGYSSVYFYSLRNVFFRENDTIFVLSLYAVFSAILTAFLYQIITYKKIKQNFIVFFYSVYFLFLFYTVFLKTPGVQGINLNIFEMIVDFKSESMQLLLNILIFIPFGFLKIDFKYLVIIIILIETIQYVLHLGIFDVTDIVLNVMGICLGKIIKEKYISKIL